MPRSLKTLACSLAVMALPVAAQEGGTTEAMDRALAAGIKAAFTCSATFNAGQSLEEIANNELDGIYTDSVDAFEAVGDAQINTEEFYVSVSWSSTLPPRYAVWRRGFGCTQLPIGAELGAAAYLPQFTEWPVIPSTDTSSAIGFNVR
ncbi:MAG: serine hydrolase, partial [Pseudomonadota bacterium]